jgi:hypothetical protein
MNFLIMLSGKSCSWRKSKAKAHTDRRHLKKILFDNDLKLKNNPYPENFKLPIYTVKL